MKRTVIPNQCRVQSIPDLLQVWWVADMASILSLIGCLSGLCSLQYLMCERSHAECGPVRGLPEIIAIGQPQLALKGRIAQLAKSNEKRSNCRDHGAFFSDMANERIRALPPRLIPVKASTWREGVSSWNTSD